jgi:hypothetical protein
VKRAFYYLVAAQPDRGSTAEPYQALLYYETYDPIPLNSNTLPKYRIPFSKAGKKERPW